MNMIGQVKMFEEDVLAMVSIVLFLKLCCIQLKKFDSRTFMTLDDAVW